MIVKLLDEDLDDDDANDDNAGDNADDNADDDDPTVTKRTSDLPGGLGRGGGAGWNSIFDHEVMQPFDTLPISC